MDDAAIKHQYDAIIARAGLAISADRAETMLNTYNDVLQWSDMIRNRPRFANLEPSNGYFVETISRAIAADESA